MNNMGLYGGPTALGPQGSGAGTNPAATGEGTSGALTGDRDGNQAMLVNTDAAAAASGSSQGSIPLPYRQRVGQYLQRLAEELNEPNANSY
jgi:hypothetical protein